MSRTAKTRGKYYRNGITLIETLGMFPDDKSSEEWYTSVHWSIEVHCPLCGSPMSKLMQSFRRCRSVAETTVFAISG